MFGVPDRINILKEIELWRTYSVLRRCSAAWLSRWDMKNSPKLNVKMLAYIEEIHYLCSREIKIRHTTIKISKDYGEDDLGRLDCKRFHS